MASLGIRGVSRLLPRMGARTIYSRAHQVVPAHLVRMVEIRAGAQQHVRSFVLSSARCMQAQVEEQQEDPEAETSLENNELNNKSEQQQMLDKKLYKMDLDFRKFSRVSPSELDEVIYIMGRCNSFTSTQALLLLRLCGSACTDDSKQIRQKRMESLLPQLKSRTTLDVSHFNAILKVNIDNDVKVDISKFLTEMDSAGVIPNRVTYNYLIGLYCMEGNITGATTVLEQMKDEGMTINESVFHSLLYGHVYNKDKDSTKETLQIMESSGLLPGAETYTWMLLAAARVKDGDRVEELLQETVEQDIKLDAGDHFKILVALCENGMGVEAENLFEKVPKRSGYFQEMRSSVPQLAFAGYPELAVKIIEDFTSNVNNTKNVNNVEERKRSQSMFISRVLAKSDAAPDRAADIVLRLFADGQTQQLVAYVCECIDQKKDDHIKVLKAKLNETIAPGTQLHTDDNTPFLMRQARKSIQDCDYATNALRDFKLYVDFRRLAWGLIRQEYDPEQMKPGDAINKIISEMRDIPHYVVYVQMWNYLLNEKTELATQELNGFLLFWSRHGPKERDVADFKSRLLENALEVESTDLIINILFKTRNFQGNDEFNRKLYYSILGGMNEIDGGLQMLKKVLVEINKSKLGVPRMAAERLSKNIDDVEIKELLDVAVVDYETPDIWTEEAQASFLQQRKNLHRESLRSAGFSTRNQMNQHYKGSFDIPEDLDKMYKIKDVLSQRGEVNKKLGDKIIQGLAERDKPAEAVQELIEIRQKSEFNLGAFATNNIIKSFVRNNKPQEALDFWMEHAEDFYMSSYILICEGFAQQGDHAKVLELLRNMTSLAKEKKMLNAEIDKYTDLLKKYATMGDVENLTNAFETILEIKPEGRFGSLLGPLVTVHLESDNIQGALDAFAELARKYKYLPARYELMTRLVQEEKVADLQTVIDLSISVRGEEQTLYNLTQVFLEQDRRSQAKKMLETPGLMYNQREFTRMFNQFREKKRLDCLEDLVIMSKNVFGCDRDHLFYSWVEAEQKNPDKIEEIWMQIQDEGHAPSVALKSKIARALKSANRTIPFSTDDLNMENKPDAPKAASTDAPREASRAAPREASRAAPREGSRAAPRARSDSKADTPKEYEPLSDSELDDLIQSLKNETNTIKLNDGIRALIRNGRLADAQHIIFENIANIRRQSIIKMISEYGKAKRYEEMDSFVASLPGEKKYLAYGLTKELNTERLVDFVKAYDEKNIEIGRQLNIRKVAKLFDKKPEVKDELEALSNEGHLPATVVLGRVAVLKRDAETLVRCWNLDTREDVISKARSIISQIDDLDHLRWITETLNGENSVLEVATNNALTIRKKQTKEILDYSMQHGFALNNLHSGSLKTALNFEEFGHKEEIQRILKEREAENVVEDKSSVETS